MYLQKKQILFRFIVIILKRCKKVARRVFCLYLCTAKILKRMLLRFFIKQLEINELELYGCKILAKGS